MEMVMYVLLFISISVTCISFFYYLKRERILFKTLAEGYFLLDEVTVKREREARRNVLTNTKGIAPRKGLKKQIDNMYSLFVYSRIGNLLDGITFEIWIFLVIASVSIIYFVGLALTKSFYQSIIIAVMFLASIILIQKLLALRNYRRVDDNLIAFMDMAENYNAVSGDIVSIFKSCSSKMPDPLRTVLDEFYYEAKTCGDKTVALYALAEKIEHPKFKEFICDIEICMRYSGDYSQIIKYSKKIVARERSAKRERGSLGSELIFNMCFVLAALIHIFFKIEKFMKNISIWEILFGTPVGQGCIAVTVITIGIFIYQIYAAER